MNEKKVKALRRQVYSGNFTEPRVYQWHEHVDSAGRVRRVFMNRGLRFLYQRIKRQTWIQPA